MNAVQKQCAVCGESFEAPSSRRRTCSDRCRKRASRTGITPAVTETPNRDREAPSSSTSDRGRLWQATHAQLVAADRLDTPLGQLALEHAAALDHPNRADTGSSRAALSKEYRAALAEAIQDAETERDDLDDILESAEIKLISGGAR